MTQKEQLQCPVCRAPFRRQQSCSRCGADLSRLMTLAAKAFILRQFSREALHKCDFEHSQKLAVAAQKTHPTLTGHRLSILTSWLLLLHKKETLRMEKRLPRHDLSDAIISGSTVKKPNRIFRVLKFVKRFLNK